MTAIATEKPCVTCNELQEKEGTFLLDVRTPGEYAEAHIPGTSNVPLPDLESNLDTIKNQAGDKEIILVCASGNRARKAHDTLSKFGLESVVLDGGTNEWISQGQPVNRSKSNVISLQRQVQITAGSLTAIGTALGVLVNPYFLIIPGFIGCGLTFAGISNTCGLAMLLARMPWNRSQAGATTCSVS